MAKSINVSKPPVMQPPKKRIPPPQQVGRQLPTGVTGDLPLPTGKVVGGIAPSSMTPAEREALENIGWTPGVPIPNNMAELLEQERVNRAAQADEVILPIDPATPPIKVETKDIDKLSPEDQERFRKIMKASFEQQQVQQQEEAAKVKIAKAAPSVPGLANAFEAASKATNDPEAIADDRATKPEEPKPAPAEKKEASKSETGADVQVALCPHCQRDPADPVTPEPPYSDKMMFLHALLGEKTFSKDYELFGGNIIVTFRTLTVGELDVIFKQAWLDRETLKVVSEADYWERINRYRLFLALQNLKSVGPDGFVHDLPDGLSKETNPICTTTWNVDAPLDHNDTVIPMIEEWIVTNVLKTEALFRIVNTACNQFTRLVAKLEAMADNSDFWKPTEVPF